MGTGKVLYFLLQKRTKSNAYSIFFLIFYLVKYMYSYESCVASTCMISVYSYSVSKTGIAKIFKIYNTCASYMHLIPSKFFAE